MHRIFRYESFPYRSCPIVFGTIKSSSSSAPSPLFRLSPSQEPFKVSDDQHEGWSRMFLAPICRRTQYVHYVDDVTTWLRGCSYDRGHMTRCLLAIVPIATIPGSIHERTNCEALSSLAFEASPFFGVPCPSFLSVIDDERRKEFAGRLVSNCHRGDPSTKDPTIVIEGTFLPCVILAFNFLLLVSISFFKYLFMCHLHSKCCA